MYLISYVYMHCNKVSTSSYSTIHKILGTCSLIRAISREVSQLPALETL